MSQHNCGQISITDVTCQALAACGFEVQELFLSRDLLGGVRQGIDINPNDVSDISTSENKSCAVLGTSSLAAKAFLKSLRKPNGVDSFYSVEIVRSDSGFHGFAEHTLCAPVGALNSAFTLSALHSVHVISTEGLIVDGRINSYVYVLHYKREALAAEVHDVEVKYASLIAEGATCIDLKGCEVPAHTLVLDTLHPDQLRPLFDKHGIRIAHARKSKGGARVIANMYPESLSNVSQIESEIKNVCQRYACLAKHSRDSIVLYIPPPSF